MDNIRWGVVFRASIAAGLLFGTTLNGAAVAAPTPTPDPGARAVLRGHAIPALANATAIQATDPTSELHMAISLVPRNQAQLHALLQELGDPGSPRFRRYLTTQEFTDQFGATQASVDAATAYLAASGLQVTGVARNRLLIDASGPVDAAQRAFGVQIQDFSLNGRTVYAPTSDPSVPASMSGVVQAIHGLDDALQMQPQYELPTQKPLVGSGIGGGYTPAELNAAYDATALPAGDGQHIALVEFDGYQPSDITQFTSGYSIPALNLVDHLIDTSANVAKAGAIEVELDIEAAAAIAPAATQDIYISPNTLSASVDLYSAIVNDNVDRVVSSSWGQCEQLLPPTYLPVIDLILSQAAAQGQAVFVAAGDSGAYSCNNGIPLDPAAALFPASDPSAIGVGGTRLLTGLGGVYGSESVWKCAAPCRGQRDSHGSGGGGGLSSVFDRLPQQAGPGVDNAFSNGKRELPDVSADADPATGYSVYCTVAPSCPFSGWIVVGGTSAAAPLWAGIASATNQYLGALGKPGFGNGNRLLYQLFNAAQTFPAYHDVTVGDNLLYPATAGYDLATGIGTPDAFNIARDLAGLSTPLMTSLAAPARLVDTRAVGGAIASGASRCFAVAEQVGVPNDAGAVVLNVTAVGQTTNGWLTVYPFGQSVPATSTLNFGTSEYAMANGTIMRLGVGGQVCVNVGTINSAAGSAQVILDVTGYLTSAGLSQLAMLPAPVRLADTRSAGGPIGTGVSRCFAIAGQGGIPGDAAAVVLNVTAVGYGTNGWLTAYPAGQAVPATSTLNFDQTEYAMANNTIMRIGTGGQVCINVGTVNSAPGSSHVVVDATAYLTTAALTRLPMLTSPQRVVDTRTSGGPILTGQSRCFPINGAAAGIPPSATGIVVNLTAVSYGTKGWLTAYPAGQAVPATSTLNFDTSEYAMANGTVIALGTGGQVCVNVGTINSAPGSSDVILDVVGYLTP